MRRKSVTGWESEGFILVGYLLICWSFQKVARRNSFRSDEYPVSRMEAVKMEKNHTEQQPRTLKRAWVTTLKLVRG